MAPCLLPKIFGVEVTPSVTSVESSEQFWRKIRQIWRICEPCKCEDFTKEIWNFSEFFTLADVRNQTVMIY